MLISKQLTFIPENVTKTGRMLRFIEYTEKQELRERIEGKTQCPGGDTQLLTVLRHYFTLMLSALLLLRISTIWWRESLRLARRLT